LRRSQCEFVPAHEMRSRANAPYANVSVGQRQLTESLLAMSAETDRLRKARAWCALTALALRARIASARTCRACAREEMARLKPKRTARCCRFG
jgi:hypothetical protein